MIALLGAGSGLQPLWPGSFQRVGPEIRWFFFVGSFARDRIAWVSYGLYTQILPRFADQTCFCVFLCWQRPMMLLWFKKYQRYGMKECPEQDVDRCAHDLSKAFVSLDAYFWGFVQTHCKNNYGLFLILRRSLTKSSLSFSCNFPYGSWLPLFLGWVMCWLHPKLCATQVLGNSLLKGSQVERPWLEISWRYWKRTPGFCGVRMGYYHGVP